jgi:hypothetical protein
LGPDRGFGPWWRFANWGPNRHPQRKKKNHDG